MAEHAEDLTRNTFQGWPGSEYSANQQHVPEAVGTGRAERVPEKDTTQPPGDTQHPLGASPVEGEHLPQPVVLAATTRETTRLKKTQEVSHELMAAPEAPQETAACQKKTQVQSFAELAAQGEHLSQHVQLAGVHDAPQETPCQRKNPERSQADQEQSHTGTPQLVLMAAAPDAPREAPCQTKTQEQSHTELTATYGMLVLSESGEVCTPTELSIEKNCNEELATKAGDGKQLTVNTEAQKLDPQTEQVAGDDETLIGQTSPVSDLLPERTPEVPLAVEKRDGPEQLVTKAGDLTQLTVELEAQRADPQLEQVTEEGCTPVTLAVEKGTDEELVTKTSDHTQFTVEIGVHEAGLQTEEAMTEDGEMLREPQCFENSTDKYVCREAETVGQVQEQSPGNERIIIPEEPKRRSGSPSEKQTKALTDGVVHITLQIVTREHDKHVLWDASGASVDAESTFLDQALCSPVTHEHSPTEEQTTELFDFEKTSQTKWFGRAETCVSEQCSDVLNSDVERAETEEKNVVMNRLTLEHPAETESPLQACLSPQNLASERPVPGHDPQNCLTSERKDKQFCISEEAELNNSIAGNEKDNTASENAPDSSEILCLSQVKSQMGCSLRLPLADEENVPSEVVYETDKEQEKKLETADAENITSEVVYETDKEYDKKLETAGAENITSEAVLETDNKSERIEENSTTPETEHETDKKSETTVTDNISQKNILDKDKKQKMANVESILSETELQTESETTEESLASETVYETEKKSETTGESITPKTVHDMGTELRTTQENSTSEAAHPTDKDSETSEMSIISESEIVHETYTESGSTVGTEKIAQENVFDREEGHEKAEEECILSETELETGKESETEENSVTSRALPEIQKDSERTEESISSETAHETDRNLESAGMEDITQDNGFVKEKMEETEDKENIVSDSVPTKPTTLATLGKKSIMPQTALDKDNQASDKSDEESMIYDKSLETELTPEIADEESIVLMPDNESENVEKEDIILEKGKKSEAPDGENVIIKTDSKSEIVEKENIMLEIDEASETADKENIILETDKRSGIVKMENIIPKMDFNSETADKDNIILEADNKSETMEQESLAMPVASEDILSSKTKVDKEAETADRENITPLKALEPDEELETAVSDAFPGGEENVTRENVLCIARKLERMETTITSENALETDKKLKTPGSNYIFLENTVKADEESDASDKENITPETTVEVDKKSERTSDDHITLENKISADEKAKSSDKETITPEKELEARKKLEMTDSNYVTLENTVKTGEESDTLEKNSITSEKELEVDKRSETTVEENIILERDKKSLTFAKENKAFDEVIETDNRSETSDKDIASDNVLHRDTTSEATDTDSIFEKVLETGKTAETAERSLFLLPMSCLSSENTFEVDISVTANEGIITSENAVENKSDTPGMDYLTSLNVVQIKMNPETSHEENITFGKTVQMDNKSEKANNENITSENVIKTKKISEAASEENAALGREEKSETKNKQNIMSDTVLKRDGESGTNDKDSIALENVLETDNLSESAAKKPVTFENLGRYKIDQTPKEVNTDKDHAFLEKEREADETSQTANDACTLLEIEKPNQTKITGNDHTTSKTTPVEERTAERADKGGSFSETFQETEQTGLSVRSLEMSLKSSFPGKGISISERESGGEQREEGKRSITKPEELRETGQTKRRDKQCKSSMTELQDKESITSSDELHETVLTQRANKECKSETDLEEEQTAIDREEGCVLRRRIRTLYAGSVEAQKDSVSLEISLEEADDRHCTTETVGTCWASDKFEEINQRMKSVGKDRTLKNRSDFEAKRVHKDILTSAGELHINNSCEKKYDVCGEGVVPFTPFPPSTQASGGWYGSERVRRRQRASDDAVHFYGLAETADCETILPDEMGHGDLAREKSDEKCTTDQAQTVISSEERDQEKHIENIAPSVLDQMNVVPTPQAGFKENHKKHLTSGFVNQTKLILSPLEDVHEEYKEQTAAGLEDQTNVAEAIQDDGQEQQEKHTEEIVLPISRPYVPHPLSSTADQAQAAILLGDNDKEKQTKGVTPGLEDQATVARALEDDSRKPEEKHVKQAAPQSVGEAYALVTPSGGGQEERTEQIAPILAGQTETVLTPLEDAHEEHKEQTAPDPDDQKRVAKSSEKDGQKIREENVEQAGEKQVFVAPVEDGQEERMEQIEIGLVDQITVAKFQEGGDQKLNEEHVKQAAPQPPDEARGVFTPSEEEYLEQIVEGQVSQTKEILPLSATQRPPSSGAEGVEWQRELTVAEDYQQKHPPKPLDRADEVSTLVEDYQEKYKKQLTQEPIRLQRSAQQILSPVNHESERQGERKQEITAVEMEETEEEMEEKIQEILASLEEDWWRSKVQAKQNRLRMIRQAIANIEKSTKENKRSMTPARLGHSVCTADDPDKKRLASVEKELDDCPKNRYLYPKHMKSGESSLQQPKLNKTAGDEHAFPHSDRLLASDDQLRMVCKQGREKLALEWEHPVPSASTAESGESHNTMPCARKTGSSEVGDLHKHAEDVGELVEHRPEEWLDLPQDVDQNLTAQSQNCLSGCFSSIQIDSSGSEQWRSIHNNCSGSDQSIYSEDSDNSSVDLDELLQETSYVKRPSSDTDRTYLSAFSNYMQQTALATRRRRRNRSTSVQNVVDDMLPYYEKIDRERLLGNLMVKSNDHSRESRKSYLQQLAERKALRTHGSTPTAAVVSSPKATLVYSDQTLFRASTGSTDLNFTLVSANQTRWKQASSGFGSPRQSAAAAPIIYGQIPFEMPEMLRFCQKRKERKWGRKKRISKHDAPTTEGGDSIELKVPHGGEARTLKKARNEKRNVCILC